MKPHPRLRRTVKWGSTVLTVLVISAWVASGWRYFGMRLGQYGLIIQVGHITFEVESGRNPFPLRPLSYGQVYPGPRWFWRFDHFDEQMRTWGHSSYHVPLWWLASISAASALIGWRLDVLARRRARVGRCPKCNYDRTGLAEGAVCPECGCPRSEQTCGTR